MIDLQPLDQQAMLRRDPVAVPISGEPGMEPVAGLARFPVPDPIGEDEEVATRIERLALAEEFARELGPEEIGPAPGRPVEDEDGVRYPAVVVPSRVADRAAVDSQFGEGLAGGEAEVS